MKWTKQNSDRRSDAEIQLNYKKFCNNDQNTAEFIEGIKE